MKLTSLIFLDPYHLPKPLLQSHKCAIKIYHAFYLESVKGSLLEFKCEILFFSKVLYAMLGGIKLNDFIKVYWWHFYKWTTFRLKTKPKTLLTVNS